MVKIYSVKVTNPSKISQSIKISNPGKGDTVIIRAESGDKFQLIEEQSANSPHKVFVKRVEDNLYVLFEEGNIQKPDLIIEQYYSDDTHALIGGPQSGSLDNYIANVSDQTITTTQIASDNVSDWFYLPHDDNAGILWGFLGAGLTAGLVLSGSSDHNDAPTTKTVNLPEVNEDSGTIIITHAQLISQAYDANNDVLKAGKLQASVGTIVDNGDGTWTLTLPKDYNGDIVLNYTIDDGHGGIVTGTAIQKVAPVSDIVEDAVTATEDTALTSDVLANDTFEGSAVISAVTQGSHGTVVINADNTITYTPDADYNGTDSYTYTVTSGGVTETATVNVTVGAVQDIAGDSITTDEDTAITTAVLANDTFEATPAVTSVTQGSHGTVVINADNTITYTPDADYNGTDSYTYTVTSGGVTETATVNVTVGAVQDIAGDSITTDEDTAITTAVLANDTFEATPAVTSVTQGSHGTVIINADNTITYTPDTDYNGEDSYTYTVTSGGVTETATVSVTINPINDSPVITSNGAGTTAAVNVSENSTAVTTVTLTDVDAGATATYSIIGGADAAKFTIDASTGALSFVSAPDFENKLDAGANNVYDVTVQVSDGLGGSDTQAIAVTVTNVNEAPVISSNGAGTTAAVNVSENSTAVTTVTSTDVDAGATATYSIVGGADSAKFTIDASTGALSFVSAPDYESPTDAGANNVYDVKVQVSDGTLTDTQDIAVTVTNVNEAPVITSNGAGTTAAVNVAENSTAVTTVTSTDVDAGATATYSIVGGADSAKFTIDASTGALSFVSAPDFENKLDAGADNIYDVTVQVSDGLGGSDTQAIAVTVTNVNEAPVISSNGAGTTAAVNVAENSTAVTTVTSTDVDAGATATYSIIGGADAAKFTIDASTGALSFISAPDYEAPTDAGSNNVYDVKVQVSDGSLTDTQDIAVTITNLNEAPVISSDGAGTTAAVNVSENSTAVTTVTSTDVDAGATAIYSIVGGADAAKFTIDASTGALSFVSAPDYEVPTDAGANNVYDVTVQVSDGLGGTDTQAIAVTVTNVNEAPVITSNGGGATATPISVAENSTAVTTVTSTDVDAGATATYSIIGGADAAKFTIDASTGALSFVSAPDYESPTDAGANNVYDVTVQVSDGSLTDTQDIAVTVTNVNEAPVITSNGAGTTASVNVSENSTAVTTVTSTDVDAGATATYSIVGGADAAKFTIDASTGALSFVSAPDFENKLDAGANNVYDVTVQVSDGLGGSDTQAIAVTVTNVNEAPVISSNGAGTNAAVNVAENNTAVTTVTSTDIDASATATYSIIGGADAAKFTIDASTGALSFVSAPDYEAPTDAGSNNVYDVTVQVSDGTLTDTQGIAVTVTNDNEVPVITSNGAGTTAAVNVSENSTAVTTVTSTDVDAGATAIYSIIGGSDAAKFTINASTGALSFVSAPDFENKLDVGADNVYDVTVQVSDSLGGADTQAIAVTVTNVNEAPVITSNGSGTTAAVNAAENSTAVTTVTSTDVDAGATATYSIIGGADAAKFTIDASTGALSFVSAPNYESPTDAGADNVYDVTVQVSDGSLTDTQDIAVTVTNVNEAPIISSNGAGTTAALNVAENSTVITTVTSTDVDAGASATYSIIGGADAAKFTIDASTGALSFVSAPDYESPTDAGANNVYDVTVQVSDGSLTDTQDIAVTVANVNEAPFISSNGAGTTAAVNAAENSTAVTTVTSTDVDAGATATYSIVGGADAAKFSIDASTGALSFVSAPDYEAPTDAGANNVYDVKVQVSDGSLTDTQDIAVTVTNVNDAPAITSNGGAAAAALNAAENTTAVTTVTSTDVDAGATATYSIVGGADAAKFTIDASTGALSFVNAPDYELPTDDGGNNVYDVTVQVSDGSLTDTQDIAVTVTNVNEAPVITSNGAGTTAAVNAAENSTAVTTVTSTDVDAGATATYSIIGGADAAKFTIDASTGALSFVSAPDYEAPTDAGANNVYDVKVQVSDGSLTDTQDIAVTVTNINDAPAITSNGGAAAAALNAAENTTAVTTVTSTDVDAGSTATYSIVGGADAAKFTIDASTGALSFVSAPDYEAPTDAGANNVYDVKVQVSDGSLTDTQDIAVTVTNVNEAPVITSNGAGTTAAVNAAENSTAVTTVTSTDVDAGATANYSIIGGADAAKFTIDVSTGALSFVSAPDFENKLDAGADNVYDVTVQVSDGLGGADTQAIAVTVTNMNESPAITSNGGAVAAAVNVAENSTAVTTVTSTDVDAGATATYSIVGGADAAKFTIDASTGALSFVSAPDFENKLDVGANNVYEVTVRVSDGLGGTDTQAIAVTVTNVNEAPEITSNGGGTTAAVNVAENSTAVTTVTSTDVDAGATATYSIIGGADASKFTINASTGALSFVSAPDFENKLDAGADNVYDVTVQVSDGLGGADTQAIAVTVTNVNEVPVISSNGAGSTAAVNVSENSTAVTTVTSTDVDAGATATYSIVGGADAAKFTIDASTGALSFVSAPDFENKLDAGANNVYDVTLQVSDGLGGSDTQAIAVTVTNVNEAPVITSNGSGTTAAVNVAENSTAVTTVTSTDVDAGATATYSIIGGADAAKFTIDASTGALGFVSAPDFENKLDEGANNVYDVTVQVSDSLGGTDTQAIAVTVTNVNEAPAITSNGGGTAAAISIAENSTAVTTVTSTDVDAAATATYSIVGGADAAKFTIDASTGALSFVSAPNNESPTDVGANNIYDVKVQVSDGSLTDTQDIAVTVTNVYEQPVISSNGSGDTAAVNVAENSTAVTTVTSLIDSTGSGKTYSITGGADAGLFTINSSTGVLSFVSAPNYESPTDAGANNVYDVTVRVSDGAGGTDTQAIAVTVTNVNEAPVITSNGGDTTAAVNVAENSTVVTTVTSTDVDAGATAAYSIIGGADAAKFTINASTGALSFVSTPNYESPTDAGTNNVYDVKVQVSDGSLTDTQDIAVTVTNVYEQPVITSNSGGDTAAVNVAENSTAVTTITSLIDSTGTGKTYSITGGADASLFAINASTGALSFVSAPDFENKLDAGTNNVYDVTVQVSDGAGGTDTQAIAVTVTNVNEAPVITSDGGDTTAAINVAENTTAVTTVTSTDVDAGATATYSIVGGADSAKFNINASTGALSFKTAPNREIPTDSGANNVYDVKVQVSDGSLTDTQDIAVTVGNIYEQPVITSNGSGSTAAVNVAENNTAVTTVTSTIDSTGTGKTYSITGGDDAALFTINASTGALRFVSAPNYESPTDTGTNNVYDVTVQVSDGVGGTDTQAIAVTVTNVNEAPVITSNGGGTTAAVSVAENSTAVATVTSTDVDAGATATYSIAGGADSARFNINASTGALSFKTAPNYESPTDTGANNVYDVRVRVSDGSLTDTQDIAVTVTNVYEQPLITSGSGDTAAVSVAENNTAVTTVSSVIDSTGTGKTYSITGGDDAALFTINASTGALSFVSAPNYELPTDTGTNNVYNVTVQISDGIGGTDTQAIAVTVTNVNEAPVITSNGGGATATPISVVENTTAVTTVTSTDVDAGATATYSIVGGADAAKFTINASTGALSFASAPNYESPTDAGANNVYDVKVQVSDGSLTDTQDIAVTVTNIYEQPVISGGDTATVNVGENSTTVTTVPSAIDSTGTGKTYSITGGDDAALFTINASTGALSFVSAPDYESPTDTGYNNVYDVTVQVSDGIGGLDSQAIAVNVTNVNEAPVITSNGGGTAAAVSVAENSTEVTTVTSTDVDAAATATYSIVGGADAALFTINASTGALSFASAPNYEMPTDIGENNVYDVTVQVSDGLGGLDTQAIAVTVTNVNELPTITSDGGGPTAALTVAENSTLVTTVTSTDVDADAAKTYSIIGGADKDLFTINTTTGVLSFIAAPNREVPTDADGNNVYDVEVQVWDGGLADTQAIAVTVSNVYEPPVITSGGGNDAAAYEISENATAVTTVTSDIDFGKVGTYTIIGGADASKFAINPATGALRFITTPNFEAPSDSDGNGTYAVKVQVSDGVGGIDIQDISITVKDVNEAPIIAGNDAKASLVVSENTKAVTTVTSTDVDAGETLTYSISGTDAALFAIDSSTGALSFVNAPNYEAPADAGANNIYDVTVTVTDKGGLTSSRDMSVSVANVNEAPEITNNAGAQSIGVNIAENTTKVLTVTSSDQDALSIARYSIVGGEDAAKFSINPTTGELRFINAPNYEAASDILGDNIYNVTVQVSDTLGGTDTQSIAVTVTNVNEAPVITSNDGKATAKISVAENSTEVTTVMSTDVDAGATATYSIVGGADASKFTINASTGALSFASGPDFENKADAGANNVYDVTVQVSDGLGGTDTQAIAVTVTNVNEAPSITSNGGAALALDVAENTTAVTTIVSNDPEGSALTYSLTGVDAARFTIDSETGVLRFIQAPNYEAAADSGTNNVYNLQVQVSDGTLTDTQDIAVTVTNVNEAPSITSNGSGSSAAVSIAENTTAVTTVTASDAEGATLTYSISGTDAALFAIDASTGALRFISAPNYEGAADSGTNNVYNLQVQVSDGTLTDTQALSVTVTNVNEAPVITSDGAASTAAVSVAENTSTAVTTVTASDQDAGDLNNLIYTIIGGADADMFAIDPHTGALAFAKLPDYEFKEDVGGDNIYDVVVQVTDGSLTDTQALAVTVTNVNEAPVITSNGGGATAALSIAENTTAVTTVRSTDVDAGATATYSITGGDDAAQFVINASTGALSFATAPDYETTFSANGDNIYDVQVQVSDGSLIDTQLISVTVDQVTPVIGADGIGIDREVDVSENTSAVTTVSSSLAGAVTYSIVNQYDADKFEINASTGELSFKAAPDFETPADTDHNNVYNVAVNVTDGVGGTDTQVIAVNVTNVNEAPVITSNAGGESAAINVAENTTSVSTIQATDVDASTQLVYNIVGGADAALFYINPATGILKFINAPNFESPSSTGGSNVYDVQVQVSDGSLCDTQNIAVTVTNVNEAPEITSRSSVSVSENTTTVTTVTSTDVDAGATATYAITGGADAGLFSINASTGTLSFVTAPNYESPSDAGGNNVYDVQVTVSDGSLMDTQDIVVSVTNVNEAVRITSDGGQDSASISVMENTTAVTTVTSEDIDANANAIYSIVGGADASMFLIDPLSGKLRFISAPNYENKLDDGKNNVYDVTVQVSDGSLTDTQNIQVTVNDVNDAPVMTANSGSAIEISIDENTTAPIDVITAADDDGQTLTYSISGTDAALFDIDTATGALTFKDSPNFEAPVDAGTDNIYSVNVTVSDGTLTDTQAVNITVEDANDAPVFTSGGGSEIISTVVAENTVMVTTLAASDEDVDDILTYTIVGGADAALFSIDPSSGELQFIDVPDFEKPQDAGKNNVYEIQVQVSDGTLTDVHNVSVTVTDVNEAPEITSNLGFKISLGIEENTTAVTTITASDVDLGATLKYSLVDGSDSAVFSIDENTGVLSFKNSPDYEHKLDAGSDNIYDVTVQVSDGVLTDTQDVSVKVNNVNEAPVLTANDGLTINADVEENSTSVTTITASDVDADTVLSYSISGGADAPLFAINASTGELRFIAAPDYEIPADAGSDNIYNVTVKVSDGILTDTQDIVVNVTNVNEAPVITSYSGTDSAAVDINENTLMVTAVSATDVDAGQTIEYSISGTDAALFNIDSSTGVLTFKTARDFESAGDANADNIYDIVVQASDGVGGVDTQTIAITLNDINENPVITSNGGGETSTVDVLENSIYVTTVSATDPDSNPNFNTLTYSLSGTDATYFTIDAATGELNFVNAPDYETDAHSYSVRVEATDNAYLTDYQDLTINVGNVASTDLTFHDMTTDTILTSYEEQIIIQDRSASEVAYSLAAGSTQITDVKDGSSGHMLEISGYANDLDGSFLTFSDGSLLKTATVASSLTGGSENDQLIGSALADTLTGAAGNDLLTGGDGNDIFNYNFSQNEGHDTIVDFSDNADKINIAGGSYAGLTITAGADAGDTLVTLSSGTTITLKGIAAANINADDFTFVV